MQISRVARFVRRRTSVLHMLPKHPSVIPYNIMKFISRPLAYSKARDDLLKAIRHAGSDLNAKNTDVSRYSIDVLTQFSSEIDRQFWWLRLAIPLYVLVRWFRPLTVVETGVQHGFSTIGILAGLEDNRDGVLYSIDIKRDFTPRGMRIRVPQGWLIPKHLRSKWIFIQGSSTEVLPSLFEKLGRIHFFCHDSLHSLQNMMFEYEIAWRYLVEGGVMVSDDVNMNPAFRKFCEKANGTVILNKGLGIITKTRR